MSTIIIGTILTSLGGALSIIEKLLDKHPKIKSVLNIIAIPCFVIGIIWTCHSGVDSEHKQNTAEAKADSLQKKLESLQNENIDSTRSVLLLGKQSLSAIKSTDASMSEGLKSLDIINKKSEKTYEQIRRTRSTIENIDTKTDEEFATTGEFVFQTDSLNSAASKVDVTTGGGNGPNWNYPEIVGKGYAEVYRGSGLTILFNNHNFVVNGEIFNLDGNLVVEIDSNKWRVNKNLISKFNFDKKGFEIFDNHGRISISMNFKRIGPPKNPMEYLIEIQGIIPTSKTEAYVYKNDLARMLFQYGDSSKNEQIYKYYDSSKMKSLFMYTGRNWRHVRRG